MTTQHPQEKIIRSFDYNGATIDWVAWADTLWCGRIGYAANYTDEPDVDEVMRGFQALNAPGAEPNGHEEDWDVCMSVNYLSKERPNGVLFGFLVDTARQPSGYDLYPVPAAQYMRVRMCDETARALGRKPWHGGIPPHQWIGEQIAPKFGFRYGDDALPIFEYYGHYNPDKRAHEFCYLYVPVEKA